MKTINDRIKELRKEGETQIEFAERMGTTQASISRYLNGRQPDRETLIKIASRSNVSLDWLLTGKGPAPAPQNSQEEEDDPIESIVTCADRIAGLSANERAELSDLVIKFAQDKEKRKDILAFWEKTGGKA